MRKAFHHRGTEEILQKQTKEDLRGRAGCWMTAQGDFWAIFGYEDDVACFGFLRVLGWVRAEAGGGNAGDSGADGGPLAHHFADADGGVRHARDGGRRSGRSDCDSGGDESGQGADYGAAE